MPVSEAAQVEVERNEVDEADDHQHQVAKPEHGGSGADPPGFGFLGEEAGKQPGARQDAGHQQRREEQPLQVEGGSRHREQHNTPNQAEGGIAGAVRRPFAQREQGGRVGHRDE